MLETVDLVRVGIGAAVSLLLCTLRLRVVLWVDTLYSCLMAMFTISYAKDTLKLTVQPSVVTDAQHDFLLETRAILLMMPSITWVFCKATVDITCRTAITLSRLVMFLIGAILMGMEHSKVETFTLQHLVYFVAPCVLWVLIAIVQLIRTGSRVNIHIRKVDVNRFLTIDLLLLMVNALMELVLPGAIGNMLGNPQDDMHIYLHRINGSIYLGLAILPWIGQRFRYVEDKHCVLMSRTVCCGIWFGVLLMEMSSGNLPFNLGIIIFVLQNGSMFVAAFLGTLTSANGPTSPGFWGARKISLTHVPNPDD